MAFLCVERQFKRCIFSSIQQQVFIASFSKVFVAFVLFEFNFANPSAFGVDFHAHLIVTKHHIVCVTLSSSKEDVGTVGSRLLVERLLRGNVFFVLCVRRVGLFGLRNLLQVTFLIGIIPAKTNENGCNQNQTCNGVFVHNRM